ncbi:hypothetical protein GCM10027180_19180 [Microbulbifer echini]
MEVNRLWYKWVKFLLARCNGEDVGLVGGVHSEGQYELVSMWVKPDKKGRYWCKLSQRVARPC